MKTVAFYTLGCKVNQYETEAISELFTDKGYTVVPFTAKADYYIINTCSVTAMSDRKSRQIIRRAKKLNPHSVVAVMGCYSQTAPDEVLNIDGVNLVLGTKNKSSVVNMIEFVSENDNLNAVVSVKDNHEYENMTVHNCLDRTRAYIKIQDGCSQFCSYCIIPYARGPVRSRCEEDIINEVKTLAANGYKEIILTGIHAASYGTDLKNTSLSQLLNKIDVICGIERVRLSSIEPMTLNAQFVNEIKGCKKLCPHFHISLQSGCDATLKRMNRHYTTAQFKEVADGLRNVFADCAITTDIMTGFAGETDKEFEQYCIPLENEAIASYPLSSFPVLLWNFLTYSESPSRNRTRTDLLCDFVRYTAEYRRCEPAGYSYRRLFSCPFHPIHLPAYNLPPLRI